MTGLAVLIVGLLVSDGRTDGQTDIGTKPKGHIIYHAGIRYDTIRYGIFTCTQKLTGAA